jgi:hypothetical protein
MKFQDLICSLPLVLLLSLPNVGNAQVTVLVQIAPPEIPIYDQPALPADGYLWTPGYWAWSDDAQDYYWVPGTWVEPPQADVLWTPGYWGAENAVFLWHPGYWGPQVGFYGGVNYGYGYVGSGYQGGRWQGGHVYYNTGVSNVGNVHVTNVYNNIVVSNTVNHVSYNGGSGGIRAAPTAAQVAAAQAPHIAPTPVQRMHEQTARNDPTLRVSANHGTPPVAATARPGQFSGTGVVSARHGSSTSVVGTERAAAAARAPQTSQAPPQQRGSEQRSVAPEPRQTPPEPRTVAPEPRSVTGERAPATAPRPESRSAPEHVEPRQAEPRPAPQPHAEAQPRPEPRPAERPKEHPPEQRPPH